ncbi:hypothetical protein TCDM_03361 [Trypanosoma cruzi Dm28c]|uniref:t-SNARE coiled-coil homology domain-containing protein n=2 Tax=Trypanosoma cruzi TaxID=5693 RepID=V5BNX1_TRYCR|nr:hypothetical protein TCDM_03361 [Trypanosoma cruzi Dm28c]
MARDRMAEFISLVPHRGRGAASHGNIYGGNVNNGCEGTERSAMWLPIDDETRPIFTSLSKIRQQVEALEALHVEQLVEMCARKREAVHDAVERICSECHLSREMIHKYNCATKQLAEGVNTKHRPINTAELRMRHNIAMFMECQLMQNVRTMWMEQKAQEERLVDATARRLKARFGVVGNSVNENFNRGEMTVEHSLEIARRLVATGNEDRSFSLARDELERVTRTRDAVLELEQEMQDLLQLFSDLQLLLQGQHEQLILIQQNVEKSCQNLVASAEHLQAAKQHKKKSCCVLQ